MPSPFFPLILTQTENSDIVIAERYGAFEQPFDTLRLLAATRFPKTVPVIFSLMPPPSQTAIGLRWHSWPFTRHHSVSLPDQPATAAGTTHHSAHRSRLWPFADATDVVRCSTGHPVAICVLRGCTADSERRHHAAHPLRRCTFPHLVRIRLAFQFLACWCLSVQTVGLNASKKVVSVALDWLHELLKGHIVVGAKLTARLRVHYLWFRVVRQILNNVARSLYRSTLAIWFLP
jgi:hypothetical protein